MVVSVPVATPEMASVGVSVGVVVGARAVASRVASRRVASRRGKRLRDGVEVHEEAEWCAREPNESVRLVVGGGLLVLGIDDEHDRAHSFRVRQHLAHRIEHQVLPEPLTLAGEVDRQASQQCRRDIWVARQPLGHLGRQFGEPDRVRRERVVAADRLGGVWMREHPTNTGASVLVLSRLLLQEPIERLIAAVKSPSAVCWSEGLCGKVSQEQAARLRVLASGLSVASRGRTQPLIGRRRREHRGDERFAVPHISQQHPLITLNGLPGRLAG